MRTLSVNARDLANGLANALAFMPAASRVREVYVGVDPPEGVMRIVGTDGYAAGMELVPIRHREGLDTPTDFLIGVGQAASEDVPGNGAAQLERAARLAGDVLAQMAFGPGVSLVPAGQEATTTEPVECTSCIEMYQRLLKLLADTKRYDGQIPGVVALDPALLARFTDGRSIKSSSRVADLVFGAAESDPVLVKIGSNFRGLVMPIEKPRCHGGSTTVCDPLGSH